jgi:hypothetical protein
MFSGTGFLRRAGAIVILSLFVFTARPAFADDEFPFGFEMTLEAAPQPGSKRIPTLEIGDNGAAAA